MKPSQSALRREWDMRKRRREQSINSDVKENREREQDLQEDR